MVGEKVTSEPEIPTDRLISRYLRSLGSEEELEGVGADLRERLRALPAEALGGLRRSITRRGVHLDRRARVVFWIDQAAYDQEYGSA